MKVSHRLINKQQIPTIFLIRFQILYNYLKFNAAWLLQQLNVIKREPNECEALPGQKIAEDKETLLHIMFHIGIDSFDQVTQLPHNNNSI